MSNVEEVEIHPNVDAVLEALKAIPNRPHMGARDPDPRLEKRLRAELERVRTAVDEAERVTGESREVIRDALIKMRAEQIRIDNTPCPTCGGDRLRADFTGSGKCHVSRTAAAGGVDR